MLRILIGSLARALIADYIVAHSREFCSPEIIQASVNKALDFSAYGLSQAKIYLSDFAVVRTYRIVGDYNGFGVSGSGLNNQHSSKQSRRKLSIMREVVW